MKTNDLIKLSDRRWMLKKGTKTIYVYCKSFPIENEFGDIVEEGNYVFDDGEEKSLVRQSSIDNAIEEYLNPQPVSVRAGATVYGGIKNYSASGSVHHPITNTP